MAVRNSAVSRASFCRPVARSSAVRAECSRLAVHRALWQERPTAHRWVRRVCSRISSLELVSLALGRLRDIAGRNYAKPPLLRTSD